MRNIAIIIGFIFSSLPCWGTETIPLIRFEHIGTEQGMSQTSARCILQDHKGFIWVGTQLGLNRYDGGSFKVYRNIHQEENYQASNIIIDLYESVDNTIWVAHATGIAYYDWSKDIFHPVDLSFLETADQKIQLVNALYEIDSVLYALVSSGYYVYLIKKKPHQASFETVRRVLNLNSTTYYPGGIACDKNKNIWFGTFSSGLYKLEPNGKLTNYKAKADNPNAILSNLIRDVHADNHHQIWVSCYNGGICRYNDASDDFDRFISSGKPGSLSSNAINTIFCDSKGRIWFGGDQEGLDLYLPSENKFYHIDQNPNTQNSLSNGSIWSIAEDNSGSIWIGTYGSGLNYLSIQQKQFKQFEPVSNSNNWLTDNVVKCFAEDKNGNIWVGTDRKGIQILNQKKDAFRHLNRENSDLSADVIKSFFVDSHGNIWIGTKSGSLDVYHYDRNYFEHIPVIPNSSRGLTYDEINCITTADNRHFWIGCDAGLNRYDVVSKRVAQYYKSDSLGGLSNHYVRHIYIDEHQRVWFATNDGINLFDEETGRFFNRFNNPFNYDILNTHFGTEINYITQDTAGDYWLCASSAGLMRFSATDYKKQAIPFEEKLNGINALGMMVDENGNFWISSNTGLYKYNPGTPLLRIYQKSDGLQSNEFWRNAYLKLHDGQMAFGGINGFNIFHPDSIRDNTLAPPIVITQLKIFNETVPVDPEGVLPKQVSECDTLHFDYTHSVFTLEFRALNYTNPELNQYAYILEPFDKEWNNVGTKNTATYTNLNPGKYTFRVKGSNNDGIWSTQSRDILIIIHPPYYETWWFYTLAGLFIIFIFLTIMRLRTRKIKEANQRLEEKVRKRTFLLEQVNKELQTKQEEILQQKRELENHKLHLEDAIRERTGELERAKEKAEESDRLKSSFLANLSHEIRTPMNAILGFSSLLVEGDTNTDERQRFQQHITKNGETLMMLIDDILDISLIESGQVACKIEIADITPVLQELFQQYQKVNNQNITLIKDFNDSSLYIQTDPLRIRQILNTLLSNAVKYTDQGSIHLGFFTENDAIEFYVADSGIGISNEHIHRIFDRFYKIEDNQKRLARGSGLGLAICKELTNMLGGEVRVESTPGQGSTFYVRFEKCIVHPEEEPTKNAKKAVQTENVHLGGRKVTIVEDEYSNYMYIREIIQRQGCSVNWLQNGREAIQYFTKIKESDLPSVVIMDILMPEVNGIEATQQIKRIFPHLPIVALTAYARTEEEKKIRMGKFDEYYSKPIKKSDIVRLMKKYCLNEPTA